MAEDKDVMAWHIIRILRHIQIAPFKELSNFISKWSAQFYVQFSFWLFLKMHWKCTLKTSRSCSSLKIIVYRVVLDEKGYFTMFATVLAAECSYGSIKIAFS